MVLGNKKHQSMTKFTRSLSLTNGTMLEERTQKFIWTEQVVNGKKTIPQKCSLDEFVNSKDVHIQPDIGLGPKIFVPFEPLSAIVIFWKTVMRLKDSGDMVLTEEMEEVMGFARHYIKLGGC